MPTISASTKSNAWRHATARASGPTPAFASHLGGTFANVGVKGPLSVPNPKFASFSPRFRWRTSDSKDTNRSSVLVSPGSEVLLMDSLRGRRELLSRDANLVHRG